MYLHRGRVILYFGAPLSCLFVLVLFFCFLGARDHAIDFRTYYAAGRIVGGGDGAHLYDYSTQWAVQGPKVGVDVLNMRYMAPPFAALFFVPLAWLGFVPAYLTFVIVNIVLVLIAARFIAPSLPTVQTRLGPVWLLFLTFFPVEMAIGQGQPTIIVLALLYFAYVFLQRGENMAAGFLVALALIKFQIVLPVVLLFALWRQWAFLKGFLLGLISLGVISLLILQIVRPDHFISFVAALPHTAGIVSSELERGTHPQSMPNIYGLLYLLGGHRSHFLFSFILSLLLLWWAWRQEASFPLAMLVATLVSNHLYVHDLSPAILALALLLDRLLATADAHSFDGSGVIEKRKRTACYICLGVFLAAPFVMVLMGKGVLALLAIPLLIITIMFPQFVSSAVSEASGNMGENPATPIATCPL